MDWVRVEIVAEDLTELSLRLFGRLLVAFALATTSALIGCLIIAVLIWVGRHGPGLVGTWWPGLLLAAAAIKIWGRWPTAWVEYESVFEEYRS